MINEISNNVSSLDYSRKTNNKNNDREAPAKTELDTRSELRGDNTVEISGQHNAEKVIGPVSGQENDVQLQSDVYHKDANGYLSPNAPVDPSAQDRQMAAVRVEKMQEAPRGNENNKITPKGVDNKSEVDETNDPMKDIPAKEESSLVDSLTAAYGKKETEVGKVIRMTV